VNGVQTVAVKIYCDQLSVSAKAGPLAEACRREIFLLRSCHDRNIVQCAPRCADPSAPAPRGRPRSAAAHSARRRAPSAAVPRPAALAVARPARALSAAPLPAPTPGGVRVARGGGLERRASPTLTLTLTLTCSRAQVCWRLPCREPECWSPSSWTTATCSASLPRVTLTLVLHNVRRFVGACLQEGQTVLVTEYMENGDLFRALAEDAGGPSAGTAAPAPAAVPRPTPAWRGAWRWTSRAGSSSCTTRRRGPHAPYTRKAAARAAGVLAARLAAEPGRRARRPRRLPRAWVTGELSGRRGRHAQTLPPVRRGSRWQGTPWRQGACGPRCWPCGRCAGRLMGRALEAEPVPAALSDRVQNAQ